MESSPWKVPPGYFGTDKSNILILDNFIALEDVKKIYNFSKSIVEWENPITENQYDDNGICTYDAEYWNNRQCPANLIKKNSEEIHDLIDFYIVKMQKYAEDFYKVKLDKRSPVIVRWFKGIEQRPHADKQLNDGSPNPFTDYDLNSLFYYNDEFDGGELYYPDHEITIKPRPGLAVMHPGDIYYLHGVKMVTAGERFTTPAFYSVSELPSHA
jgi:hypothetical protein